ncbi:MAG: hydrogenase maturation peptidase HycI [Endomicrobiia bacterium]|nr:hydrogenase maturation peptidase HycI [Endomicrobiaceae bacterium]MDD3053861.1 hydrogenase maturation peptidase HycI [Endomicrobiaceae bacterium]MDD3923069.1 hydrogenase maturation peptidase HycI [Endomicrobiaceae bacterium]
MTIKQIRKFLKQSDKLLILAIGSELRNDDAVGMYIADELIKQNFDKKKFSIIKGATAPENFTGEIKKYKPTDMLIIDAADTGKKPGEIDIIDVSSVVGASFSTHMMPINVFLDYLFKDFDCRTLIVGIQPRTLEFGTDISKDIKKTADELVLLIKEEIENGK